MTSNHLFRPEEELFIQHIIYDKLFLVQTRAKQIKSSRLNTQHFQNSQGS